jgi:hypothetical protein
VTEASKEDVALFLKRFKGIVASGSGLHVIHRKVNNEALIGLGITKKDRREILLGLSVEDYCEGPIPDRDRPGHLWIFGKGIGPQEVYIKLKIAQDNKDQIAKCISFHIADYSMKFPYK